MGNRGNPGGVRQTTHDPVTGVAFPCHASYVRPKKGACASPRYKLKVPDALCDEWGIKSKCVTYPTLAALVASDLYKRVVDSEMRLNHQGLKRVKRTAACRDATVREYEKLVRDGVPIPPQIVFRPPSATWSVTRTFGTGWTFRSTALTYEIAMRLYEECTKVRSVAEVVGDAKPTPRGYKAPFSRKVLARADAEGDAEKEVVVEAVAVEDSDEEVAVEDSDEEVDTEEVEGFTVRASRSGRQVKRPSLYITEAAQSPQPKRAKAVVGRPVLAVAVDNGGPSAPGLADEPTPVYDDADAMRSLKTIRERIAHLL
jgi:hypothetical protein